MSAEHAGASSRPSKQPKKKGKAKRRTHRGPTRPKQRAFLAGALRVDARGAGMVETAEGPFYIPARRMREAMNGDRVQVRPLGGYHGRTQIGRAHV